MDWYALETLAMMDQKVISREAKEHWKYASLRSLKRVDTSKNEIEGLQGKAVHVLQEMLDSDNAELRLKAADIVMRHSLKTKGKMRLSS
ncbi:hypothetical protein [Paenibacillus marinisediminis]